MAHWHFQTFNGFEDINQSSSAEAFSSGSIRDLATAIVREGVQNVLDARSGNGGAGPVRLRMILGSCNAMPAAIEQRWFDDLMPHVRDPRVGAPDPPDSGEPCEYLAFEDFGTKGLVGDYTAPFKPGQENNFVNFMYHDGVTGKAQAKLGSRGVGKIVFTMASRARTLFAYTIRETDPQRRPLLVGKNLLKFREFDGKLYGGQSYFLKDWPTNAARQPVDDSSILAQFTNDFPISRKDQPGLSIVIPYVDPSITAKALRHAVVQEYHYALLAGRLEIDIDDHGQLERLDSQHLPQVDDAELNAQVALARWAIANPQPTLETALPTPSQPQRLDEKLVPDPVRQAVAKALNQHERLAVRFNLHIHPKHGDPLPVSFDAFLEYDQSHHAKPVFIRDLLPVSDVREAKSAPQVRALVIVHSGKLADMLRAAEGANHTDWSPRTDEFQKAYVGRRGEIAFVAQAISKLVEIARGQANEPVGGISTQFFSTVNNDPSTTKAKDKAKKPGADPDKPPDDLEPTSKAGFVLKQDPNGFTIKHNPGQPLPKRLAVRVAYDVLRGSPWGENNYDPADFDFRKSKADVRVLSSDAQIDRPDPGNRLLIQPKNEQFEVVVTGFDPNRDLIVDVRDTSKPKRKAKEAADVDQTHQLHQPQPLDA